MSSSIEGFYKKTHAERLEAIKNFAGLSEADIELLQKSSSLDFETANRMVENVFSTYPLPLGLATNFTVNAKDYLIPFALEEPSVVAASSNAAKLCRENGGFAAVADEPVMTGQIQLVQVRDFEKAKKAILSAKRDLLEFAKTKDSMLVKLGGGPVDLALKEIETPRGKMLIAYLDVNVLDAMGANAVNTMCESLSPKLEELSGGKARLRIISNLALKRKVVAKAVWTKEALQESTKGEIKGEDVVEGILDAWAFAFADEFRCATHNKGIMNGIDAVAIACGQDWRALEAGAHAFASLNGKYKPLTTYSKDKKGNLVGEIELPMACATIGGATRIHPVAQVCLKILGAKNSREMACVFASVGLAQNFAALRALSTVGIQSGHMKLHSRTLAASAGAKGKLIDEIADKMIGEKNISFSRAQELFKNFEK